MVHQGGPGGLTPVSVRKIQSREKKRKETDGLRKTGGFLTG